MCHPIKKSRCHFGITKDRDPFSELKIGCDNNACLLIKLAGRSADAAKEIKSLIGKSSTEVANGVQLIKETGEALAKISEHVTEIDEHIDTISQGAEEQLTGIQ